MDLAEVMFESSHSTKTGICLNKQVRQKKEEIVTQEILCFEFFGQTDDSLSLDL